MKNVMKMSKNNQEHRDSTTDFFLNFISKEKEKPKTEEKHITVHQILQKYSHLSLVQSIKKQGIHQL